MKPLSVLDDVTTDLIYISLYPFVFEFTTKEELLKVIDYIRAKNKNVFFLCYVQAQDPRVIDFMESLPIG